MCRCNYSHPLNGQNLNKNLSRNLKILRLKLRQQKHLGNQKMVIWGVSLKCWQKDRTKSTRLRSDELKWARHLITGFLITLQALKSYRLSLRRARFRRLDWELRKLMKNAWVRQLSRIYRVKKKISKQNFQLNKWRQMQIGRINNS